MSKEEKELFYSDLIYRLKQLAGFELEKNEEVNYRIEQREKGEEKIIDNVPTHILSEFQEKLFQIIHEISIKATVNFNDLKKIANYPELVNEQISILEGKITLLQSQKISSENPVLIRKKEK